MGNQDGIVSGFFTALFHAVLASLALFVASSRDGPYASVVVITCVVTLVCCVGLIVRSHFSCILLLLLDVAIMVLAITWCVSIIITLRAPPPLDAESFSQTVEKVSDVAELVAAGFTFLLSIWLTRRTRRLEKRLRMSRRQA